MRDPQDLRILRVDVDEVLPGTFGEVTGAHITAWGTLYKGWPDPRDPSKLIFDIRDDKALRCFLDEQPRRPLRRCYLLWLTRVGAQGASTKYGGPYHMFLIIERAGGDTRQNVFRRIGFAFSRHERGWHTRSWMSASTGPPVGGRCQKIKLM
jgi:hypothetical protein